MAAGLKFTDQDKIWFQNRRMRYKEWKYRNLAGSRSPSVLSWGLSEFSRLLKTFLLFFKPTHNGLSSSTLLPPRLWHWRGQRVPSSHLPHLSCTLTSIANGPSTSTQGGESHHRAGISNWPEGFLMVVSSVLIKIWMIHPLSLTYERQGDVWLVRLFRKSQNTFMKHFN